MLLWVGKVFNRREGSFSEHLEGPDYTLLLLLSSSSSDDNQNGPPGKMTVGLLPSDLVEPVELVGDKARN